VNRAFVAVAGGGGFVGSHVVVALARAGMRVRLLESAVPHRPEVKRLLDAGVVELCTFQSAERGDGHCARALEGATALVHLRYRMPSAPEGPARLAEEAEINCADTFQLLAAAEKAEVGHVCFASSTSVYAPSRRRVDELAATRTEPAYAAAKLMQERAVVEWSRRTSSVGTVLRLSTVYGPGETVERAIPNFIRSAVLGSHITVNSSGLFDPVYVGDVALAVLLALSHRASGIFNIGSGQTWPVLEVARLVVAIVGSWAPIETRRGSGEDRPLPDVTLATSRLGFRASTPLQAGLAAEIAWFRDDLLRSGAGRSSSVIGRLA
jgi:nucleoside-diphosphate-sugar epimerase